MSLNRLFLSFSALCDFLKKYFFRKKNFKNFFFEKKFQMFPIVVLWIFLSLRYGADLRRSCLVFWLHSYYLGTIFEYSILANWEHQNFYASRNTCLVDLLSVILFKSLSSHSNPTDIPFLQFCTVFWILQLIFFSQMHQDICKWTSDVFRKFSVVFSVASVLFVIGKCFFGTTTFRHLIFS